MGTSGAGRQRCGRLAAGSQFLRFRPSTRLGPAPGPGLSTECAGVRPFRLRTGTLVAAGTCFNLKKPAAVHAISPDEASLGCTFAKLAKPADFLEHFTPCNSTRYVCKSANSQSLRRTMVSHAAHDLRLPFLCRLPKKHHRFYPKDGRGSFGTFKTAGENLRSLSPGPVEPSIGRCTN